MKRNETSGNGLLSPVAADPRSLLLGCKPWWDNRLWKTGSKWKSRGNGALIFEDGLCSTYCHPAS